MPINKKVDRSLIKTVRVFDLFEGTEIGHNNKALAVEVTIQSDQKTLTDDELEINACINHLIAHYVSCMLNFP